MAMAGMVLMHVSASAPASCAAFAVAATSAALGLSFTQRGFFVASRQALVTLYTEAGSVPNWMPPSWMLGQEMFISSAASAGSSPRVLAASAYWSTVCP